MEKKPNLPEDKMKQDMAAMHPEMADEMPKNKHGWKVNLLRMLFGDEQPNPETHIDPTQRPSYKRKLREMERDTDE